MDWLSSLPVGVLVVAWLALAVLVAVLARIVVRAVVPEREHDDVSRIASPLMPALGAAFAIFTALTLTSEAGALRSAETLVSDEASEASRLAWASTSPHVQSESVQSALGDYLDATRTREWNGSAAANGDDPAVAAAIARLEHAVRVEAAKPELGTPASTELLASLDAITTTRRERIAAASHGIPVLYVIVLIASGVALIANAAALTFRNATRTALLVAGLAALVGLSLALLFSLDGPWRGPLTVSGHPIDSVLEDLRSGFFQH
jgi:hypothetical protein